MMFAQLGYIRFVRPHYVVGIEGTIGFGFAEHPHVEGKPSLQAVGDPLDGRVLDMRFDRSWCDPQAVFDKLMEEAAKKEAMALTFGDGTYEGLFVVTEVTKTFRKTGPDGTLLRLDARLTLKEYVEQDPIATAKRKKVAAAPARKRSGVKPANAKKGTPTYTVVKSTNKDGYTVEKIVRKE